MVLQAPDICSEPSSDIAEVRHNAAPTVWDFEEQFPRPPRSWRNHSALWRLMIEDKTTFMRLIYHCRVPNLPYLTGQIGKFGAATDLTCRQVKRLRW